MDKLKEILAYIIKSYPNKDDLSNARLTKMIYLSDWRHVLTYNKQISNISWYFDNYGPYVKDILKTVEKCNFFTRRETTNTFGESKTLIGLKDVNYEVNISTEEKSSIDYIKNVTQELNWTDFIKLVYSTYPIISTNRYNYFNLVEKAQAYKKILEQETTYI